MKKIIFIITVLLINSNINSVVAQSFNTEAHGFSFEVNYDFTGEINNQVDSVFAINAVFNLQDTIHIAKIYLQVGTTPTGYDLFQEVFVFDQPTQAQELIYFRQGQQITIGIGELDPSIMHYYEARIEDIYGHISPAININ
jgi:hypothetical protein